MSESNYYQHKDFLRSVGIKSTFIYRFLQSLSSEELKITDKMKFMCMYLKFYDNLTHEGSEATRTLSDERERFIKMGFVVSAAYDYVYMIKDIFLEDTTINWIYRIVERYVSDSGYKKYNDFVKRCRKRKRNGDEKSDIYNKISKRLKK